MDSHYHSSRLPFRTLKNFLFQNRINTYYASLVALFVFLLIISLGVKNSRYQPVVDLNLPVNTYNAISSNPLKSIAFNCTEREKTRQVKSFFALADPWNGCADPVHLYSYLSYIWPLYNRPITLINIGANKGYNLVKWWEAWLPQSKVNTRSWGNYLKLLYPLLFEKNKFCGTCGDCYDEPFDFIHHDSIKDEEYSNSLRIIGVEPSYSNFELLLKLQKWSNSSILEIYNYAASDKSGEAKFPYTKLGSTTGSLSDISDTSKSSETEFKSTRIVTVDELVQDLSISTIDYLLIDAEGFDPLIIQGAKKSLASAKISLLEFEYHSLGPWYKTKLKDVVEFFGRFEYDCYLKVPQNKMVKLTGCFDDSFETHKWSNVLCVHRSQAIVNSFMLSHCHWLYKEGI